MKTTGLHNLFDRNPKALSTYETIRTIMTKLWYLKYQGLWITSEGDKLNTEGDIDGLKLAMKKLAE